MRRFAMLVILSLGFGLSCLAAFLPSHASADDGFRCKSGRLVSVGDTTREVRHRCGDPDYATSRTERRTVRYRYSRWVGNVQQSVVEEREVEVPVEEWTYDLGPNAFVRYVTFENGRVVTVTSGDYGR